jgi:hypothetical protein
MWTFGQQGLLALFRVNFLLAIRVSYNNSMETTFFAVW